MGRTRPAPAERGEPAGRPLLSPAARPLAVAIVAACAGTTALLGVLLGHGAHTDPVDTAVDSGVRASLAGHPKLLELLARLGDLPAIAGITAILVLACLLRRRYRGAALVAVSVPAAAVITERLLKPLVGRTALGFLSFPSGHATGTFALATAMTVLLAGAPARVAGGAPGRRGDRVRSRVRRRRRDDRPGLPLFHRRRRGSRRRHRHGSRYRAGHRPGRAGMAAVWPAATARRQRG